MTPWVKAWEDQAELRPDAVAVTNAHGQRCTFAHLRQRAHSQEHRLRMLGLEAGDRLMVAVDRKHPLDDLVVNLWACGLRRGVWFPDWGGFTRRQNAQWELEGRLSPRLKIHSLLGREEVFAMPGPGWHDIAFAWPERALDGGARDCCPMTIRNVSHAQLAHGVRRWRETTGVGPGSALGWMGSGLCGLSWLSIVASLAQGAHLVQLDGDRQDDETWLASRCAELDIQWLLASPRWLSRMGLPWAHCPQGVLAPWGLASPSQRWRWCEKTRWIEAWDPAACGWWWGSHEFSAKDSGEVPLTACTTYFSWKVDARGGFLWVMDGEQWQPLAMVSPDADGVRLGLSSIADRDLRGRGEAIARVLRTLPLVGAVACGEVDGKAYLAILPRSDRDNPSHVLRQAQRAAVAVDFASERDFQWSIACSVIPWDERGGFAGSRLLQVDS